MSTPEDRRLTGRLTLATLGKTIPAAPPPPANRQAVPVPPPAAPRAKAVAAKTPAPAIAPSPPLETEEDRRVGARIDALRRARELFADAFNDDDPKPLPQDITRRMTEAGIADQAAGDLVEWWAALVRRREQQRQQQRADDRIAARVAALAAAREHQPEMFDIDNPKLLPHDIAATLKAAGIRRQALQDMGSCRRGSKGQRFKVTIGWEAG